MRRNTADTTQGLASVLDVSAWRTLVIMIRTYGTGVSGDFILECSNQNADDFANLWKSVGTKTVSAGGANDQNALFVLAASEDETLRYLRWRFDASASGTDNTFEITGYGLD